jgi:large subunit ribosomal protein L35
MPKIRTNKTAVKRFKITGTGKITRTKAYNSHQFLHKKASRKRRLELTPEVFRGEQRRMRRLLVLGQVKVPVAYDAEASKAARTAKAVTNRAKLVAMVTRS